MEGSPPADEIEYLRKISEAEEFQVKVSKRSMWGLFFALLLLAIFVVVSCVGVFREISILKAEREATVNSQKAVPPKPKIVTLSDAYTEMREGDLPKSLQIVEEVLRRNPRDYEAYYYRGQILVMQGNMEAARESFRMARDIFSLPRYQEALEAAGGEKLPTPRVIPSRN